MMKRIINLYKPVGLTPLQAIDKFRANNSVYKSVKMSYAGRLDPMAEGVLVILVGEENKKMKQYMRLDKEYRAEILIGIRSDSNDVLGLVDIDNIDNLMQDKDDQSKEMGEGKKDSESSSESTVDTRIKDLKKKIKSLKGSYEQKIPAYSSYRIKGKPMFYYARKGQKVEDIMKKVLIKSVKVNSIYEVSSKRLLKYVLGKIGKVDGDFRQVEIKKKWNDLLKDCRDRFLVADITINCSSGTYIRAIADDLGGLLLSLKRIRVGRFEIRGSLKLVRV